VEKKQKESWTHPKWSGVLQKTKGLVSRRKNMVEVNASAVDDGNIDVADIDTDSSLPPSNWKPEEAELNDNDIKDKDVNADG
jgi:hypothetical protein